jgi:hypothetical protein
MRTIKIEEITYGSGVKRYRPRIYIETTEKQVTTHKHWFNTVTETKLVKKTTEYVIASCIDGTYIQVTTSASNFNHFNQPQNYQIIVPVDTYEKALELIKKLDADTEAENQKRLANTIVETKFIEVK